MAQYDVFANPNPRSKEAVPYLVDVQSTLLESLPTRLVMPLSRVGVAASGLPSRLVPLFTVENEKLALHAHEAAGIDARLLKKRVTSLRQHAGEIRDALDAVVSGI
ncbi:MAG TPA: CcdB family protein [Rhizobacter sp.]|nr:CcdB family protein [Rhizobacter sp.]